MDAGTTPTLPTTLASTLDPREIRTVYALVAGLDYQAALSQAGYPTNHKARRSPPRPELSTAAAYLIREIAYSSGVSRKWILTQTVALYRRATQAEVVRDRKGRPTGEWRYDGATASKCLELLGKEAGVFGARPGLMPLGDVAQLVAAVAARGRPGLPGDRARVITQAPAAEPAEKPA